MPSEAKVAAVERLTKVLEGASSIYLTDFTGMPVEMMSELRRKCREADVEYRVVKDSLTKLAAERAGVGDVIEFLEGPVGLALGHSDQMAPARVLSEFAKTHKLPRMKAALVENRIFGEKDVRSLAALPSREVLLGQFAAGLRWPLTGFAGVINQIMWKMIATIEALAKAMEGDAGAGESKASDEPGGTPAGDMGTDSAAAEAGSAPGGTKQSEGPAETAGSGGAGAESAPADPGPEEDRAGGGDAPEALGG